jgi:hypothetical protein
VVGAGGVVAAGADVAAGAEVAGGAEVAAGPQAASARLIRIRTLKNLKSTVRIENLLFFLTEH